MSERSDDHVAGLKRNVMVRFFTICLVTRILCAPVVQEPACPGGRAVLPERVEFPSQEHGAQRPQVEGDEAPEGCLVLTRTVPGTPQQAPTAILEDRFVALGAEALDLLTANL